ncbi:hypothetical protein H4R33_000672 [Dimargaris cristalligena]|nr:hypothetical protein H4R33_000672 [Dimargaris cristalligena]
MALSDPVVPTASRGRPNPLDANSTNMHSPKRQHTTPGTPVGGESEPASPLFRIIWHWTHATEMLTCLTTGRISAESRAVRGAQVIVATQSSKIAIYSAFGQHVKTFDTNYEAICSMATGNVTRIAITRAPADDRRDPKLRSVQGPFEDLIVGDSHGSVSVYGTGLHLLSRDQVSTSPILCMHIRPTTPLYRDIIAGDMAGTVLSVVPHQLNWKRRLADQLAHLLTVQQQQRAGIPLLSSAQLGRAGLISPMPGPIRCLLGVDLPSVGHPQTDSTTVGLAPYILVGSHLPLLQVLSQGQLVTLIELPAPPMTLASGYFVVPTNPVLTASSPTSVTMASPDSNTVMSPPTDTAVHPDISTVTTPPHRPTQVIVGCDDGTVHLIDDQLQPHLLFQCDYTVTQLHTFRPYYVPPPNQGSPSTSTSSAAPSPAQPSPISSSATSSPNPATSLSTQTPTHGPDASVCDWIVVAGHTNRLFVYEGTCCRTELELNDWPLDVSVTDLDYDGYPEIIVLEGERAVKTFGLETQLSVSTTTDNSSTT